MSDRACCICARSYESQYGCDTTLRQIRTRAFLLGGYGSKHDLELYEAVLTKLGPRWHGSGEVCDECVDEAIALGALTKCAGEWVTSADVPWDRL